MNDLKKETENKEIPIDCKLDKILVGKIETFLRNKILFNVWSKRYLSWQLNLFFEESLNNYKVKLKSFEKTSHYLNNKRISVKKFTFKISESSFQIYNGIPVEERDIIIEKSLNWWLVLSSKHLWPSCLSCVQNNQLDNNFCNLACIKDYLKDRGNYNLCKHPIRGTENDIIFWEQDCDCDKIISQLKIQQTI